MKRLSATTQISLMLASVVVVIALAGIFYVERVNFIMTSEVETTLADVARQGADGIRHKFQSRLDMLETLAAQGPFVDSDVPLEEKIKILTPEAARRKLIRFGVSYLDGNSLTSDGYNLYVGDRPYFSIAFEGKGNVSDLLTCRILNLPIVVHVVPVYDRHHVLYALLYATEHTRIFSELVSETFYGGKGKAYIMTSGGSMLDGQEKDEQPNLLAMLEQEDPKQVERFQRARGMGCATTGKYRLNGEEQYIAMAPIEGTQDWWLVATIATQTVLEKSNAIIRITVLTFGVMALLCIGVLGYILWLRRQYAQEKSIATVAIESAGLYILAVTDAGSVISVNPLFAERMQRTAAELEGMSFMALCSEGAADWWAELLHSERGFELTMSTAGGHLLWVQWHVLHSSHAARYMLLGTDVSAQRKLESERQTRAVQHQMQSIVDNMPSPMMLKSPDGRLIVANEALLRLTRMPSDQIIGKTLQQLLPLSDCTLIDEAASAALTRACPVTTDYLLTGADGEERCYQTTQVPLYDDKGFPHAVVCMLTDTTERKRSEQHMAAQLAFVRALLDSSPVSVVISVDGLCRFVNPRGQELMAARVGSPVSESCADSTAWNEMLQRVNTEDMIFDVGMPMYDPEHCVHDILITCSRTEYEGEPALLIWGVDVTSLKMTEKQLTLARDAAEKATVAKSEFLARMSHEIRTPMNGIIGMTYLAIQAEPTPEQRGFLDKIQRSANYLLDIINDILDFSKIEAGKMEINVTPFCLSEVLEGLRTVLDAQASHKGLQLAVHQDAAVPQHLRGDVLRINQILLNLMSNAIKFTECGTVSIAVSAEDVRLPDLNLHIMVCDTGIGMSAEQMTRLFESFTQADGSITRKYGGTGLGLAISKRLADLMGGTLWAESVLEQGSIFHLCIPVEEYIPSEPVSPEHESTCMASLCGMRVLLAEDNEINQEIGRELLRNLGAEVQVVSNGMQAVDAVAAHNFDIVLMDIQMPELDGLSATRLIRQSTNDCVRTVPIVAMTANAMTEDSARSLAAGMNAHITKPIDLEVLQRTLLEWARRE